MASLGLSPARRLLMAFAALALGGRASAQSVLVVEHNHAPALVRDVSGNKPCIEEQGRLVTVAADRYALQPVAEYLPYFISIRGLQVENHWIEFVGDTAPLNRTFHLRANFVSAYPLPNVFLMLDIDLGQGQHTMFLQEVGRLFPHEPRSVECTLPLATSLAESHYQLHVFSGGAELLNSEQPFNYREAMLDRMVAKRIPGRPDGPPAPFVGPSPEYPPALLQSRIKGRAVVRLRIRETGAVSDATVVNATAPAFGEAALASLRQWRFFPRIRGGHPTAAVVNLPVDFTPPAASGAAP